MSCELFSVFDSAAKRFLEPFYAPTIEYAIRSFRQTVNSSESTIQRFPEDYTLFHIGSFDQESGMLNPGAAPVSLGVAITFVEAGEDPGELPLKLAREGAANA